MNSLFSTLILFFISLVLSSGLAAQNFMYESEQGGRHVAFAYSKFMEVSSYGGELGYTWKGKYTASLGYAASRTQGRTTAGTYSLAFDALVVKQDEMKPLSLSLGAFYGLIDLKTAPGRGSQYGAFASLYREFQFNEFSIFPSAFLVFGHTRLSNNLSAESDSAAVYGFRLYLRMSKLYMSPSIQMRESEASFSIILGWLLPS